MDECVECGEVLITGLNGEQCLDCLWYEKQKEVEKEQMALYDLKHDLVNTLQQLKKFDVGYSGTHEAIAVKHNGQVFYLRFELTPFTLEGAVKNL